MGIPAEDYDIQDNFGETDHNMDLFAEIEKAFEGWASVFDTVTSNDLIMAFFPCIYFSAVSQMNMSFTAKNNRNLGPKERADRVLERSANRERFFRLLVQLVSVAEQKGLRLVIENPWSEQTFLKANFVYPPTFVDADRSLRGDYYKKPTAYWFINCERTTGETLQRSKEIKSIINIAPNRMPGICNEERSMISPDYARNFICDFILGCKQPGSQLSLF